MSRLDWIMPEISDERNGFSFYEHVNSRNESNSYVNYKQDVMIF
jgi:hypothetical protein